MGLTNVVLRVCLAIVLFSACTDAAGSTISLAKATFKLSYVQDGEKMHRAWVTTTADTVSQIGSADGFSAAKQDAITVQASFEDEAGEPVSVHQAFLRFVNRRTRADNLFLLKRKGRDMRADVALKAEVKVDADFWSHEDVYAVELVMGDLRMRESVTWTITEEMRFREDAKEIFERPERGVFDFDVGVKKVLLPEFFSPVPEPQKRASLVMIIVALVGVMVPLPLLFVGWSRLGVFPLRFPQEKSQQLYIVGFEACMVGHVVALVMFWVKWNIVTTWKFIGALMIPTLVCGRSVLSSSEKKR